MYPELFEQLLSGTRASWSQGHLEQFGFFFWNQNLVEKVVDGIKIPSSES